MRRAVINPERVFRPECIPIMPRSLTSGPQRDLRHVSPRTPTARVLCSLRRISRPYPQAEECAVGPKAKRQCCYGTYK